MASPVISSAAISFSAAAVLNQGTAPWIGNFPPAVSESINAVIGSSAGDLQYVFAENISVANGTPWTLDLVTGDDPSGNTLAWNYVNLIVVMNLSTTGGDDLTIGAGTHPVWGATPASSLADAQAKGGVAFLYAPNPGYAVTSGSHDTITITCASGTAPANVLFLGR